MPSYKLTSFAAFVVAATAVKLRTTTSTLNAAGNWVLDETRLECTAPRYSANERTVEVEASPEGYWDAYSYLTSDWCYDDADGNQQCD